MTDKKSNPGESALRDALDVLLRDTPVPEVSRDDPVQFPRRYPNRKDREITGWISAALAYGRRDLFLPVLQRVFAPMGNRPYLFIKHFSPERDALYFRDIRYRFNNGWDLAAIMLVLRDLYAEYDDLESFFLSFDVSGADTILPMVSGALGAMRDRLAASLRHHPGIEANGRNPWFLLPDPAGTSPLKRPLMFCRWMVRDLPPDMGVWPRISRSRLVYPLDVHIFRFARRLGLTRRRSPSLAAALEITRYFRRLAPADPLRYDFPLIALGAGHCPAGETSCPIHTATGCPLAPFCNRRSTSPK